jgi:hypothetical protein
MLNFLFLFFLPFSSSASPLPQWGLSDVSVLLPLPQEKPEVDLLLKPSSQGQKGPFLPPSALALFQFPFVNDLNNTESYAMLRVVALRLDPCFTDHFRPLSVTCQKQVRLVWQPVWARGEEDITTLDAAFHSFYVFDEAEFFQLAKELLALKQNEPSSYREALDVPFQLSLEGLTGKYWNSLRKILEKHLGEKNLVRVTQMSVRGGNMVWAFSGFERENPTSPWTAMSIAGIPKADFQNFINRDLSGRRFDGGVFPAATKLADYLDVLVSPKWEEEAAGTPEKIPLTYEGLLRMENPLKYNPGTLDCVSCHTVMAARTYLEEHFSEGVSSADRKDQFRSPFTLKNLGARPSGTNRLRNFGYFEKEKALSQRVIHESALAAETMNALFKKDGTTPPLSPKDE